MTWSLLLALTLLPEFVVGEEKIDGLDVANAEEVTAQDLLPYLGEAPPTGQVAVEFCNTFKVVEKPYYVIWVSTWVSAVSQQVIDMTRYLTEEPERLSPGQKFYVSVQLLFLLTETLDLIIKVDWLDVANPFVLYNLYVYVFVHSSVFVRSVMMSMIVWDWYDAQLLKRPVFGQKRDGRGWSDVERAILLVIIFQFASSAFVMVIIIVTHLVPAVFFYYWIFLIMGCLIVKSRVWVKRYLGLDPDGRFARGLILASNSFMAVVGLQSMMTSMVRVYAGQWIEHGYMIPVKDDYWSRRFVTWYQCHVSHKGFEAFQDQDFSNLFIR